MNFETFAYWLRGFYELNGETALTKEQSTLISKHLTLVFTEEAKTLPPISETTERDYLPPWKNDNKISSGKITGHKGSPWTDVVPGIYCAVENTVDTLVNDFHKAMDRLEKANAPKQPVTVSCSTHGKPKRIC